MELFSSSPHPILFLLPFPSCAFPAAESTCFPASPAIPFPLNRRKLRRSYHRVQYEPYYLTTPTCVMPAASLHEPGSQQSLSPSAFVNKHTVHSSDANNNTGCTGHRAQGTAHSLAILMPSQVCVSKVWRSIRISIHHSCDHSCSPYLVFLFSPHLNI
jgi:hypothetical protein